MFSSIKFIHFCFSAAVSAPYQMPFAESCLTLLCTNTWASVQTEQCPLISSRFRQPLFILILLTHSGSSLEMKMENFTWEWVLVEVRPWAGYKTTGAAEVLECLAILTTPSSVPVREIQHRKFISFLIFPYWMDLVYRLLKAFTCSAQ